MKNADEFDKHEFESFLSKLNFTEKIGFEGIQTLLQFYCLHGVKEDAFSMVLALYLQEYSRQNNSNFTTVVNSGLPKVYEITEPYIKNTGAFSVTLPTYSSSDSDLAFVRKALGGIANRTPVSDITIYTLDNNLKHIIELKSDRSKKYLFELQNFNKTRKFNQDSLLDGLSIDLQNSATHQVFSSYQDTVFWQGILVYGFQEVGRPFPERFPKYVNDESGVSRDNYRIAEIRTKKDEESWYREFNGELENLKSELHSFLGEQKYLETPKEVLSIKVAQGTINLHGNPKFSNAQVTVQSQLLIFEVKASPKYLEKILPLFPPETDKLAKKRLENQRTQRENRKKQNSRGSK